ncbi:MAG: GC-type dockerin domain-anchored protein [Planctomycetota bacterium]
MCALTHGLAIAALCSLAGQSHAQLCGVHLPGMPDFDQIREGLPNLGKSYCVPTTLASNLAYLHLQGYNGAMGTAGAGVTNWQSQQRVTDVTNVISTLGFLAGTNPASNGGTPSEGFTSATETWLGIVESDEEFTIFGSSGMNMDQPKSAETLRDQILLGALPQATIGWYTYSATEEVFVGSGSHVVALTSVSGFCGNGLPEVTFRDPGSGDSLNNFQSIFRDERSDMIATTARYGKTAANSAVATYFHLPQYSSSAYLRGWRLLLPLTGVGTSPAQFFRVKAFVPYAIEPYGTPGTLDVPNEAEAHDVALSPDTRYIYFSTLNDQGSPALLCADRLAEQPVEVIPLPFPGPVETGRFGEVYVGTDDSITRLVPHQPDGLIDPEIIPIDGIADDLLFDDQADQLLALQLGQGRILQLSSQDFTEQREAIFSFAVPASARPRLAMLDGAPALITQSPPALHLLSFEADGDKDFVDIAETRALPGAASPTSAAQSALGTLVVTDRGRLREYRWNPDANAYEPRAGYWDGEPWGGVFEFSRSRDEFSRDPQADDPELPQVEPSEANACVADITTDGTNPGDEGFGTPDGSVSTADLAYFVERWVASSLIADVTSGGTNPGDSGYGVPDGEVTAADLSYFVEIWLAGCP